MWRRSVVLSVFFLLYTALVAWVLVFVFAFVMCTHEGDFGPLVQMLNPLTWELDALAALYFAIPAVVFVGTQAIFVLPVVRPGPLESGKAKSLKVSLVAAGLLAAILTSALAICVVIFVSLVEATGMGYSMYRPENLDAPFTTIGGPVILVCSWVLWSFVFFAYSRKRQGRGVVGRVIGLLIGGTIVEVLLILPVDIMVRKRTDCYCGTGTFWSLVASGWALLWLGGPGALVIFLRKRHRAWAITNCEMCGYLRGPSTSEVCPECGHAWVPPVLATRSTQAAS